MAAIQIIVNNIERMQPAGRSNCDDIKIDCNMRMQDMKDIIALCCEQIGEEEFMEYVTHLVQVSMPHVHIHKV